MASLLLFSALLVRRRKSEVSPVKQGAAALLVHGDRELSKRYGPLFVWGQLSTWFKQVCESAHAHVWKQDPEGVCAVLQALRGPLFVGGGLSMKFKLQAGKCVCICECVPMRGCSGEAIGRACAPNSTCCLPMCAWC